MTLMIGDNQVVSMHYKLTNDQGDVLDSSEGREPLTYLHGAGNIIPGLEKELTGKIQGSKLNVTVAPEEGYGTVKPELVQQAPKQAFESIDDLEVGMQLMAQSAEGQQQMITVKEISDDSVTIDGNHPLAGQTLHFDVEVTEVRDATTQELEHGHVHDGGHDH